jgi:hypothetical protein
MVRHYSLFLLLAACCVTLLGAQSKPAADVPAARKVSDAFVADLVADRVSDAIAEFDRQWVKTMGQSVPRSIDSAIHECGKPKGSKADNARDPVIGDAVFQDGRKKVTPTFLYPASNGHLFVEVEPGDESGAYYVGGFGCQKNKPGSGQ